MITKIIHMSSAVERDDLVNKIIKLTGASIFEAIVCSNGVDGCRKSHMEVYKQVPENEDLLIFEDDCVINDPTFLDFIEANKNNYDLIYLGVNSIIFDSNKKPVGSYGTHSMWISSKALKICLNHIYRDPMMDWIWNEIEYKYKLKVLRPNPSTKYTYQAAGLKSYIIGKCRGPPVTINW